MENTKKIINDSLKKSLEKEYGVKTKADIFSSKTYDKLMTEIASLTH